MKMQNIILLFLLGIFTAACSGTNVVADSGYLGSGYTKEELEAKGVNIRHLFVFTEQRATYNGRTFSIGIPIDSLITTFGPGYRTIYGKDYNTGYDYYCWDEIGFIAWASPEKVVIEFGLHWDYQQKEEEYQYNDPEPEYVPAKFFKGKILLNGVPLDNTSDYAAYCKDEEIQRRLLELARENGVKRNYHKCLYHFVETGSLNQYNSFYHKLFFFDYTAFGDDAFFSYKVKIATKTRQIHEFGMQYDIYENPNFITIF